MDDGATKYDFMYSSEHFMQFTENKIINWPPHHMHKGGCYECGLSAQI